MADIKDHEQTVRRVTHHLDQEEAGAPAMMRQSPQAIKTARVEGDYCTLCTTTPALVSKDEAPSR